MSTQFITLLPPPGPSVLTYPIDGSPPPSSIPQTFVEALSVREVVFVHEQCCSFETEIDDDDARSWHWVVYASVSGPKVFTKKDVDNPTEEGRRVSEGGKVAVGTVRLVPPPHPKHPTPGKRYAGDDVGEASVIGEPDRATDLHDGREAYVKLGRMATLKEYRGLGLGRLLVNTALEWAAKHPDNVYEGPEDPVEREKMEGSAWKGLVLVHAQSDIEKFWASFGFVRDDGMGEWWEEGIRHVGMWKRLDIRHV